MQFTEKFIQALKSKDSRHDVREKSGEGFAIRISPSGEKAWIFFYSFEGNKKRLTLGKYPAISLADARKKHRDAIKILAQGKDPGLEKQKSKIDAITSLTTNDLIEEYLEKWAKPRKRSWQEDQRILYKDIRPLWGKRKAKDITKRDIVLLLERIQKRGAPIAANRTLACVRRMFNFAIERDIIPASPCMSVKALSKENRRERCLTTKEIKNFWIGLDNASMAEITKLALKFQLATAQRKGEVVTAEWEEIDLQSGWWVIPAAKAKNNYPHRVPLSQFALSLLYELKTLSGSSRWLFPSPKQDQPIGGSAVDHAIRKNLKHFKDTKPFTPHDLRRSGASKMTEMGISRLVVSKLLNHVENSVTAIYDRHSYDTEKRNALDAWANRLKEIIYDIEQTSNVITLINVV